MAIQSTNPATGQEMKTFPAQTSDQVEARLAAAVHAFRESRSITHEHRALCLRKLASLLEDDIEELARLMVLEVGKPIRAARAEVEKCAATCRFYAENGARMLAPELLPNASTGRSYVRWDPIGIVLAIMPWNFPFWQVFRFLAPTLMAGNAALLKHASNVPQCALAIEALVRRAGFPRGIFQALLVQNAIIPSLLEDARVVAVTLTGSERAGTDVASHAGANLKKCVLELGGSDPFLVLPTADLSAAVDAAATSRTLSNGQSCIAAKRFIVHASLYEEFVRRLSHRMESMKVGDPMREDTDIGPLISLAALENVERQIRDAVSIGGRIVSGGSRLVSRGFFLEPTVLVEVPRTSAVYREEIFGPVAMVFAARDLDEAFEIANDTPFGLGASVWTRDPAEQQRAVSEIEAGMVYLNAIVASDPHLPFGGIKRSGYGRELSAAGIREFMNAKTVYVA